MRLFLALGLVASTATALLLAFLAPQGPRAGTALRMDLGQVVERSELVLEARVISSTAVEVPGGSIWSDVQLQVERTFLGPHQGVRTVRLPGGVLPDGRGMLVPGMPMPTPGEDLFLMLTEAGPDGRRVLVGLGQGRYRILRDLAGRRYAVRGAGQGSLVDGATGTVVPAGGREVIDYSELVAELESASAAARARRGDASGEGR